MELPKRNVQWMLVREITVLSENRRTRRQSHCFLPEGIVPASRTKRVPLRTPPARGSKLYYTCRQSAVRKRPAVRRTPMVTVSRFAPARSERESPASATLVRGGAEVRTINFADTGGLFDHPQPGKRLGIGRSVELPVGSHKYEHPDTTALEAHP